MASEAGGGNGQRRLIRYSREQLLAIGQKPGLHQLPADADVSVFKDLDELTFYDAGLKPDWAKERHPAYGARPLDFLRPGSHIRSRLVADGSLPEELPPPPRDPMHRDGSLELRRAGSWRDGPGHERWNGPPGGRLSEEIPGPPGRRPSGGRWDEGKDRPADNWRAPLSPPNASSVDRWNRGPAGPVDERGAAPRAARWQDDARAGPGAGAGVGAGGAGAPGSSRWGGDGRREQQPPPRREGWGDGGDREREWARRDPRGEYRPNWESQPAWMQEEGGGGGGAAAPPPPRAPPRGAMTAKDLEAERQQFQAAWRARQAEQPDQKEDDLAYLRSDEEEDGVRPLPPPRQASQEAAPRQPAPGMSRFGFKLVMDEGAQQQQQQASSAPPPPPPPPPPYQQQQEGSGGEAAGPLVGKKLTFDQFKQAAAAATSTAASPRQTAARGGPPPGMPAMPMAAGRVLTAAELEQGFGAGGAGGPNHPAPPQGDAGRGANQAATNKLLGLLKRGPGARTGSPVPPVPPPPAAPPGNAANGIGRGPAGGPATSAAPGLGLTVPPVTSSALGGDSTMDDLLSPANIGNLLSGIGMDDADSEPAPTGKAASSFGSGLGGYPATSMPSAIAGIWGMGGSMWAPPDKGAAPAASAAPGMAPAGGLPSLPAAAAAATAGLGRPLGGGPGPAPGQAPPASAAAGVQMGPPPGMQPSGQANLAALLQSAAHHHRPPAASAAGVAQQQHRPTHAMPPGAGFPPGSGAPAGFPGGYPGGAGGAGGGAGMAAGQQAALMGMLGNAGNRPAGMQGMGMGGYNQQQGNMQAMLQAAGAQARMQQGMGPAGGMDALQQQQLKLLQLQQQQQQAMKGRMPAQQQQQQQQQQQAMLAQLVAQQQQQQRMAGMAQAGVGMSDMRPGGPGMANLMQQQQLLMQQQQQGQGQVYRGPQAGYPGAGGMPMGAAGQPRVGGQGMQGFGGQGAQAQLQQLLQHAAHPQRMPGM